MKFTLSWLKDHLDTDATLDEIVEKLTQIGLEVEAVDDKAVFKPFVIARVLTAEQHPDADRLRVLVQDHPFRHGVRVSLDGRRVIDEWHSARNETYEAKVALPAKPRLRIEFFEGSGDARIKFEWERIGG